MSLAVGLTLPAPAQVASFPKTAVPENVPAATKILRDELAQLRPGVVVEKIEKNSAAEQSGLREGDILLTWARGEAHGTLDTTIDFSWLQLEQAPRGAVTIYGTRRGMRYS
ncbi:MAG TPA: hypothetical protein VGJ30_18260, partial [Candidatus Angelobacter sp.]